MTKWERCCKLNDKGPKKFAWNVPIHWNSTYELFI